jgi:hypothetical protein
MNIITLHGESLQYLTSGWIGNIGLTLIATTQPTTGLCNEAP